MTIWIPSLKNEFQFPEESYKSYKKEKEKKSKQTNEGKIPWRRKGIDAILGLLSRFTRRSRLFISVDKFYYRLGGRGEFPLRVKRERDGGAAGARFTPSEKSLKPFKPCGDVGSHVATVEAEPEPRGVQRRMNGA